MEEEVVNYIEAPWDCQDLDPYRDDPKGDGGREVMDSDMVVDSREEPGAVDADRPLCTCGGGCPKDMPTREEQLCCREVKTWQSEKSEGENLVSVAKYNLCLVRCRCQVYPGARELQECVKQRYPQVQVILCLSL
jgi:hypothetical protein